MPKIKIKDTVEDFVIKHAISPEDAEVLLVCLGDLVDRGISSVEIIKELNKLKGGKMDRKVCDGCGKEIKGYFTKIVVNKMVHDGKDTWHGVALAGEPLVKEYDMCDKCTPVMIVTKAFCGGACLLCKIKKEAEL